MHLRCREWRSQVRDVLRWTLREMREAHLMGLTLVGRRRSEPRRTVGRAEGLSILVDVPSLPPCRMGGSERSMASLAKGLAAKGHKVTVLVENRCQRSDDVGLSTQQASGRLRRQLYPEADVVISQLDSRDAAIRMARRFGVPFVHLLRNGRLDPLGGFGVADLLVFNAEWLRQGHIGPERTLTLHPSIDSEQYRVDSRTGDRITQVNLSLRKGGDLFFRLAELLPDRAFLGVLSDYDQAFLPERIPENVELQQPVEDMRDVYSRTRILLLPSRHEPFGRVGLEAALSGIPVLASPLPGIEEALASSGIYLPIEDPDRWVEEIRKLDAPSVYAEACREAKEHGRQACQPGRDLVAFEAALRETMSGDRLRSRRPAPRVRWRP